jgi:protein O-GlcNAc transferase
VIRLKPDYAEAHAGLGRALAGKHDPDSAIAEYHEAIRLNPDDAETHANLGVALEAKGERQTALEECRRAVELDPKDTVARRKHEQLAKEFK